MSFFWPTRLNQFPGPLAYLGRFVHWASIIFAIVIGMALCNVGRFDPGGLILAIPVGLVITLIGRFFRRVLAWE